MAMVTIGEAVQFVRTRLDEVAADSSDNLAAEIDDTNLELTVERLLPESVEYVHRTAPRELVAPVAETLTDLTTGVTAEFLASDNSVDITFASSLHVMRILSFRAWDSPYVVTQPVDEDSPVGRMQQDRWVHGRPDSPVLVLRAEARNGNPHLRYHSLSAAEREEGQKAFSMDYVPYPEIVTEGTASGYETSDALRASVLNDLTGRVMTVYGWQQAQAYLELSGVYAGNGPAGKSLEQQQ